MQDCQKEKHNHMLSCMLATYFSQSGSVLIENRPLPIYLFDMHIKMHSVKHTS